MEMRARFLVVILSAVIGLGDLLAAMPVRAQSLADTDDVLEGQQYLVRADDLVVADPYPLANSHTQVQYFSLDTESMLITTSDSVQATAIIDAACVSTSPENTPFPAQTQPMRMFNLPYDVVVTLAPSVTASGSGCSNGAANGMDFYVKDPITNATYINSVGSAGITNHWLQTAVADFDGDGFDDLFFSSDTWTYVATAHDTDSPSSGIVIRSSLKTGSSLTPMADPTVGDFNADGNLDVAWMGTEFSSGSEPIVHFATVCAGPVDGTVCANANSFEIVLSSATITPSAPSGSIVTVGGKCTETDSNQSGSELRAPPMAVAAGQFDASAGDELVVVALYEDSSKDCRVVAESYTFTQFADSGSTGQDIVPKQEGVLDNLGPHSHIGDPASIYAVAGNLDWSSSTETVAIAISGSTEHNIMVVALDDNLRMTSRDAPFNSGNDDKSFAGLTIGRFSSAPAADASKSCTDDSQCTDTCESSVCEISGADCTSDGDCAGTCTSGQICSYIKPSNYNLQIAGFLMARNHDHNSLVYIYTADPSDAFTPKEIQSFDLKNFEQPSMNIGYRGGSLLRAGDLEGRSQRLGPPTVVRIQQTSQPDLILGAPPTHADWISFGALGDEGEFCEPTANDCPMSFNPDNLCNCTDLVSSSSCADGSELRCLVNFSVLSGTFVSQYSFDDTDAKQSSTTDTTSYSLGLSIDLKEKTKSLTPTGLEFTQEVQFASENTYNHSVSTTNSTYKTIEFDGSTTTGFGDEVWYSVRDYNVYFYPVIGQTICVDTCQESGVCSISTSVACTDDADCPDAASATNCAAADMQQLYVQYSGASSVTQTNDSGINLEWYQPIHEPGQILSYPWDCNQLASRYGVNICNPSDDNYTLLSETSAFSTSDSPATFSMNWSIGSGQSRTAVKGGQWSQSLSETASVGTSSLESEVEGFKVSEKLTINASESYSTAKTNTTDLGASMGISILSPGSYLTPTKFAYGAEGFIMGDAPKPGTLQQLTPTDTEGVTANGVIRGAFTVDPAASGSGSWWASSPYHTYIDVALNRPKHLSTTSSKGVSDPSVTQCRPDSAEVAVNEDCVTEQPADPTPMGLWTSDFYYLRGLFITPADAVGQGPQLMEAGEGDVLALQARVYNYSLRDMSNTSEIKVDFYAQPWDTSCHVPVGYYNHDQTCSQSGGAEISCSDVGDACDPCCIANAPVDSIWLGRDALAPLPAFNSTTRPGEPNWAFATTTFDTGDPTLCGSAGCGGKYFAFWVVVWAEGTDSNDDPVLFEELPDHSLTGIPPVLKSIADLCPKSNNCLNGTCGATRDSCVADTDCPTAADNTCGEDGTCAVSGVSCTSDSDCGDCLCAICMDRFSNNVGLYNQELFIEPAGEETGASNGDLGVEYVTVSPTAALVDQKTVVRVGLSARGGTIRGQLLRFQAVPPNFESSVQEALDKIRPFDSEMVSRIPPDTAYQVQAAFHPQELGSYEILVSTFDDGEPVLLGTANLDVVEVAPTPTRTIPPAPPNAFDDDDGCAISTAGDSSSRGVILLSLFPLLFVILRSRQRRRPGADGGGPRRCH